MRAAVLLTVPLCALLLAGCTSSPVGPAATAAGEDSSVAPSAPAQTPTTPPPTQTASEAKPIDVLCKKLLPTAVARTLRPDLKVVEGWTPDAGTGAASAVALHGTACEWRNAIGDTLEVAVSKPSPSDATALKNDLVRRSNSVPTYGGEAYFQVVDHRGVVDVFRGRTWLSLRSNLFYEPGDAQDVVAASLAGLGLGPKVGAPEAPATPDPAPSATETPAG